MLEQYESTGASQILVEPVPEEDVSNYGIVDCNGEMLEPGDSKELFVWLKNQNVKKLHLIYLLLAVMFYLKRFGMH